MLTRSHTPTLSLLAANLIRTLFQSDCEIQIAMRTVPNPKLQIKRKGFREYEAQDFGSDDHDGSGGHVGPGGNEQSGGGRQGDVSHRSEERRVGKECRS